MNSFLSFRSFSHGRHLERSIYLKGPPPKWIHWACDYKNDPKKRWFSNERASSGEKRKADVNKTSSSSKKEISCSRGG